MLERSGGNPPVEGQRSRDKGKGQVVPPVGWSRTSDAPLWTSHELVLSKFVCLIFKRAPLVDRSCTSAPPYGQVTN